MALVFLSFGCGKSSPKLGPTSGRGGSAGNAAVAAGQSGTAGGAPASGGSLNAIAFAGTRSIVVGDNGVILAVDR